MTREEAITVLKAFMENPLFSNIHKAAFNIAIHDIKQRHDWDINNLILINKDNYEPNCSEIPTGSTPKNDLGVDLVSRAEVLKLMQDNWHTHNGDWAMQESMDDIRALPSVTPIRPKGHWMENAPQYDMFNPQYICSECGNAHTRTTPYCEMCGADMREAEDE